MIRPAYRKDAPGSCAGGAQGTVLEQGWGQKAGGHSVGQGWSSLGTTAGPAASQTTEPRTGQIPSTPTGPLFSHCLLQRSLGTLDSSHAGVGRGNVHKHRPWARRLVPETRPEKHGPWPALVPLVHVTHQSITPQVPSAVSLAMV